jgi:EmrB/QacA subfamily drug resistance transporter
MAMSGNTATVQRRWLALTVLSVGTLMFILSETIVNVALRSIQRDLGFTQSSLAWVVNAYLIAFGGLLLLAGRLGDLLGRRRVFLIGLAVFVPASLASGFAGSQGVLIAARFVQGAGAALTAAVTLSMIVMMFPEPRERAKAIGIYSFTGAAGASIGVTAGGLITQVVSWHWIFFVNVPIGVVAFALATRVLARDRGIGLRRGADVLGAVLVTAGLMLGVYTIVSTADFDWASGHTAAFGAASIVLLIAFVVRQAMARNPLVALRVFRSRRLAGANAAQALMAAGMFGFQFMVALFLQLVLGYTPLETGLAFLPITFMIGTVSLLLSAPLTGRFGARNVLLAGMALLVVGLGQLAFVPPDAGYLRHVLPSMVLLGIGAGLGLPTVTTLAMAAAAEEDAGLASGLTNTMQQVGGALGLAVAATLAAGRSEELLAAGQSEVAALTGGYHVAFGFGAAIIAAAAVLTVVLLRPQAPSTAAPAEQPELVTAAG